MLFTGLVYADDTMYILHDKCINSLYEPAVMHFENSEISVLRDSRGVILRFKLDSPIDEYTLLTAKTGEKLYKIRDFLAKIKNPVIIEVHTAEDSTGNIRAEKNWEISAVIAGKIETAVCGEDIPVNRVHSVGYGEFLPENNTSNNGGKLLNRVDIIILCNINGE